MKVSIGHSDLGKVHRFPILRNKNPRFEHAFVIPILLERIFTQAASAATL